MRSKDIHCSLYELKDIQELSKYVQMQNGKENSCKMARPFLVALHTCPQKKQKNGQISTTNEFTVLEDLQPTSKTNIQPKKKPTNMYQLHNTMNINSQDCFYNRQMKETCLVVVTPPSPFVGNGVKEFGEQPQVGLIPKT